MMAELVKGLHILAGVRYDCSNVNVVAILENDGSAHVVDCGDPGYGEQILGYLRKHVRGPPRVRTIILTHFDADHSGSAAELKRMTGCVIMAPEFDAKIISGKRFANEEVGRILPAWAPNEVEALQRKIRTQEIPSVHVDRVLRGEERLDIGGGVRVLRVPGHTPGHIVLLLPKLSALITGDVMTAPEGRIGPPVPQFTPSPNRAIRSLKNLSELEFEIMVTYHFPPITVGASKALKKYLGTLKE
jgi:glyoxylase-like metal-dependent hydrolase (beta-lactamase superfamily II)